MVKLKGVKMQDKLKAKLAKERKSHKWFIQKYLPDRLYSSVMLQINGFTKIQEDVRQAIDKYLKEGDK